MTTGVAQRKNTTMEAAALAYATSGRSPVPILHGRKIPSLPSAPNGMRWKDLQETIADEETICGWFATQAPMGVGIICGKVSGKRVDGNVYGLEVIDIDDETTLIAFLEQAGYMGLSAVIKRLVYERTPGRGGHFGYLCEKLESNQKLAKRAEKIGNKACLIETRGEGGFIVSAPTTPGIHPDCPERGYVLENGSWEDVPVITVEEREALLTLARSFTQVAEPTMIVGPPSTKKEASGEERPGDRLNKEADTAWWSALLEKHGWSVAHMRKDGVQCWQRPGKTGNQWSATLGACGEYFYVFSTNAEPFEAERGYMPFSAYTLLEHKGDFKQAARALAEQYGMAKSVHIPLSDYSNALALVKAHKGDLHYCTPWKSWLVWEGTHWQRDESGVLMRHAKQTITAMLKNVAALQKEEAAQNALEQLATDVDTTDEESIAAAVEAVSQQVATTKKASHAGAGKAKALLAHIKASFSTSKLESMIRSAQSEPGIPALPDAFDADPWVLNCANGTVDLRTGLLRPHAQEDYLTKCLQTPYLPEATCANWDQFLWRIMGGTKREEDTDDMSEADLEVRQKADDRAKRLIGFLQRAVGYALTGSNQEQCLFILHGITKTGKSTFLAVLRVLLGPYAKQADMATFMHKEHETVRNDLADLAGSRFVCAVESSEGQRLAEALIKQVTGGVDLIKARFLFQEYFEFPPQFKVFLGTNHKPVVRDTDSAIWERLRLIPFTVQIPAEERDKTLHALLITELPGILAWAVRGCLDWQKQRGLAEPAEVLQATTTYRNEMDIVGRFIDDACYVTPQVRAKAGELYSAYKKWCEGQTEEKAVSMRAFSNRLDDLGYEKVANNGIWRVGITLRDVSQHAEE